VERKDEVPGAEYDETDWRENGANSHLLFNETRLSLGEPGYVRRDAVHHRVRCARARTSFAPSGVGEARARERLEQAVERVEIDPIRDLTT
jgi:hypothetical protein